MRALRFHRYGRPEVLRIEEVREPVPREGEAKVRIRAVALNPLDWKLRAGHLRFLPVLRGPPRGLGCDFAGEIVAVGGGATQRHVGERVFGSIMPFGRDGALAEFLSVNYARVLPMPEGLPFEQAATLPIAAGTALQAVIDDAGVQPGQRVLITGAAGGVGHFAVQIAKHAGAHVVGVCSSANVDFVTSLGADEVIDYTREDFTRRAERFDAIFDAAGASSFVAARRVLTDEGRYVNTGGDATAVVTTAASALFARLTSRQRAVAMLLDNGPALWRRVLDLVQAGVVRPHIERTIGLEDVAQAQHTMARGHARGKIVVRVT